MVTSLKISTNIDITDDDDSTDDDDNVDDDDTIFAIYNSKISSFDSSSPSDDTVYDSSNAFMWSLTTRIALLHRFMTISFRLNSVENNIGPSSVDLDHAHLHFTSSLVLTEFLKLSARVVQLKLNHFDLKACIE